MLEVQRNLVLKDCITLISVSVGCKNLNCGKWYFLDFALAGQMQTAFNLCEHPLRLAAKVLHRLCHVDAYRRERSCKHLVLAGVYHELYFLVIVQETIMYIGLNGSTGVKGVNFFDLVYAALLNATLVYVQSGYCVAGDTTHTPRTQEPSGWRVVPRGQPFPTVTRQVYLVERVVHRRKVA